jgi:hypothetical protein
LGRFAALLVLSGGLPRRHVAAAMIGLRTMAVRPGAASLDAPVLPSMQRFDAQHPAPNEKD